MKSYLFKYIVTMSFITPLILNTSFSVESILNPNLLPTLMLLILSVVVTKVTWLRSRLSKEYYNNLIKHLRKIPLLQKSPDIEYPISASPFIKSRVLKQMNPIVYLF